MAALALVGSLVAGCGGSGESKTTTVESTVTAPAPSGPTAYSGTTEQGLPISFGVTPGAVVELTFGWRAPCADGRARSNSIRLQGVPLHDGAFAFSGTLETGGVVRIEGRIDGDRASGSFARSGGTAFGVDCKVAGVAWQARAGSESGAAS